MFARRLAVVALLGLLAIAPVARADDDETQKSPTLVVRLASIDALAADARYLAELVGQGEFAKQAEGVLKAMTGEKGVEGVDPKRPMGLYGWLGPNGIDSKVVALVPVADDKTFLAALKKLNVKITDEKGGLYSTQPEKSPFPIYFRFSQKYVYASLGDKKLVEEKRLLKASDLLPDGQVGAASASLDVAGIPADLRKMALGQIALRMGNSKEKKDGETRAQHALRVAAADELENLLKTLLTEGGTMNVRLDIDRKAEDLTLTLGLVAKPDSELAKDIQKLGAGKSLVAGLVGKDSAAGGSLLLTIPKKVRSALDKVIDEGLAKALKEKDKKDEREKLEGLFKAITPTLKLAVLDGALDLRGPSAKGLYTAVIAARIKEGLGVEKYLKELVKELPGEISNRIGVDADKVGKVNIHKLDAGEFLDENSKKALGDGPLYLALRDDAVFVASGEKALSAIKEAVAAKAVTARVLYADVSVARTANLDGRQKREVVEKAIKEAFGKQAEGDRVRLSLEGGKALNLKLSVKGPVVRFFGLLDKAKKDADGQE